MKNNSNDKKSNLVYYVALALGVVALAILIGMYTYYGNNRNSDQYVSLDSEEDGYADASLEENAEDVNAEVANAENSDTVLDADSSDTDAIGKADLASNTTTSASTDEETDTTKEQANNRTEETDTQENDAQDNKAQNNKDNGKDSDSDETASNKITEENDTDTETKTGSKTGASSETKSSEASDDAKETSTIAGSFGQSLAWPVQGNVLLPYSMDSTVYYQTLDAYKSSTGMVISSKKGTSVTAACAGTVSDITKDDVYGNMVTVDIGDGYTLQYGQLDNISVAAGDRIAEGQQLGQVAAPTDSFLVEGANLYLAMQKDGSYVNPEQFMQ